MICENFRFDLLTLKFLFVAFNFLVASCFVHVEKPGAFGKICYDCNGICRQWQGWGSYLVDLWDKNTLIIL
jgi:hypothetical protein